MSTSGQATAQQMPNEAEEPSMDDIMASIRQIIAEDEQASHASATRENYTHPTDPSNVNEPVSEDAMMAAMEQEMQAVVAEDVAAKMEAPIGAVEAAALPNETRAHDVENLSDGVPTITASAVAGAAIATGAGIHERAEQVRTEMGVSSVDANGLTLEQRLEKYRVRGREQEEIRHAKEIEAEKERRAEAAAVQRIADAMPTSAQHIAPQDIAKSLLDQSASSLNADMTEVMRPYVRQWISDNLPGMVEKLVREEIERVSRGKKLG